LLLQKRAAGDASESKADVPEIQFTCANAAPPKIALAEWSA